ncbi:P-loop containing nucleoside triphosphate hydrolase protein [Truncatella angustata]|uniref:P-loop containing nucleoside triphosphate hydrolase protein n=1 Tax=Truncatella angustata TaxID=152316 RepID=A0A9P8UK08_9PEZI|nr:P-loop containing nucleoside triphosphate hydrolase protein [Truncatella angustata]KAH6653542.1 P-loop containing nucleoside triphosphate hydrolase protein [Truncatella angustata]
MSIEEAHILVPFGRNDEFVGRESVLRELVVKILPSANNKNCQRTVLEGLGGVGKTQIALEAAYRVFEQSPNCSIFWVPAVSLVMFENAYRDIGEALGTPGMDDDKADIKELVKTTLERSKVDWLLIIDNIDDIGLLTRDKGLKSCLPFNRKGSILFTTRNHEVAVRLNISRKHTFVVDKMSEAEAIKLLQNELKERQYRDTQATKDLVQHLVFLPLAVKQASAYMARTRITTAAYHKLCRGSDNAQIKLLNTGFEELQRYSDNTNPITLTWLISFQHLAESYPLAIEYLKFVCLLAEKDIPMSLLPIGKDEEALPEAVGILEGYAFVSIHEQGDSFDMHRLVRLVTRNWIKNDWEACYAKVVRQLAKVYPVPKHDNRQLWTRYMPHAQVAIELHRECIDKKAAADLLFVVAGSYNKIGRYEEAEQMHRQTLELKKSVLGPGHPSTIRSRNNLQNLLDSLYVGGDDDQSTSPSESEGEGGGGTTLQ